MSAEDGTDAMESPRVRQPTEVVTRLQKVDYYYATISHKRHLADTRAASQ